MEQRWTNEGGSKAARIGEREARARARLGLDEGGREGGREVWNRGGQTREGVKQRG